MSAGQRPSVINTLESFSSDYVGERNERLTPKSRLKKISKKTMKEYLAQSSSTLQSYLMDTRLFKLFIR
jgi:hypothetical protein